jgi:hypothetical protein
MCAIVSQAWLVKETAELPGMAMDESKIVTSSIVLAQQPARS